jgi:hypothetical protein
VRTIKGFQQYSLDDGPLEVNAASGEQFPCGKAAHNFRCTKVPGHSGRHEAGVSNGRIVASWDNETEAPR